MGRKKIAHLCFEYKQIIFIATEKKKKRSEWKRQRERERDKKIAKRETDRTTMGKDDVSEESLSAGMQDCLNADY